MSIEEFDLFGTKTGTVFSKYKMPQPQYLGAKTNLLPWIADFIPSDAKTGLDGFAGSQCVAFEMKKMGLQVHTNDLMNYSNKTGIALVQNKNVKITKEDLDFIFAKNENCKNVMQNFADIFFIKEECQMLDSTRANIDLIDCEYKKALLFAIINRSLTRKTIMGHFAHTKAVDYANNPDRVKRNPSIAKNIKDIILSLVGEYNDAVFDNGQNNQSYNQNILELLPNLKGIDVAYYDPPYCNSHSDYQSFYHLLETFTENWQNKEFINGTKRYHPPRHSGFDKVRDIEKSFNELFDLSRHIPVWIISYNDRSVPNIDGLVKIASQYKKVELREKEYKIARGGKGSVGGSKEYLLVCREK